jgi:hypothetical protein
MKPYRLQTADLQVPDEWKDHTVHSFVVPPAEGAGSASFVITRDADSPDEDVARYSARYAAEAAKSLRAYHVLDTRPTTVGGRPSVERTYTWTAPDNVPVHQRQLCVRHAGAFLVITMTARSTDFPVHEPAWGEVVRSFRFT